MLEYTPLEVPYRFIAITQKVFELGSFNLFIALWKAYNKSKQIAQFLQRKFSQIFAQTPLMGICTFSVFLEYNLGFASFSDVFAHMNSLSQGRFLKMYNSMQFAQFFCTFFA